MRDFNRIHVFCENLEKLWIQYPDQRFCQLVDNYIHLDSGDCFYQEDDDSMFALMHALDMVEDND